MFNPEVWKTTIGKKKLEDAMKRLNLDDQRIRSKNLASLGLDFLNVEKSKVKSELKKYDQDFSEIFKRMPNRNEKEVMKPLYAYYKNLKTAITLKGTKGGTAIAEQVLTNNFTKKEKVGTVMENGKNNGTGSEKNKNSSGYNSLMSNKEKKTVIEKEKELDFTKSDPNKKGAYGIYKNRRLSRTELIHLEREGEMIKREQFELKQRLYEYQKEFQAIHNRRVRFFKDIQPVEYEYQKYKENKINLRDIQQILASSHYNNNMNK